ncbi:putative polyketide synthase [Glonium stellatum]|uniref:Putative polyketide synthase n=1 Tax=Glonium stellatum TaxID=574774 RepID=A0A8E2FBI6_9PEZI|nr:putative polyketide synthase [Glonium stellatum]
MVNDMKTKLIFFSNEFPNDDLRDLFRRLQRHSKDTRFRHLAAFLEECTRVVKEEALKLPQQLQDLIPNFGTVLNLVDHGDFRQGPLGAAMESVTLCVLEIGMLIGHYEGQNLEYDLPAGSTTLAGLSIGLLAGAAVSLSTSLADLVHTGAESVRVSFRLGVYVDEISRKLESREVDANLQSWAYVVAETSAEDVQREIDQYNAETHNPELTKVFISAADKTSVSVSGPPSRLKNAFQHSHVLRYSKFLPLPVYDGLCHAPHLYSTDDINFIINGSEPKINRSLPVRIPLLSSRTGKSFSAKYAGELLEQISTELLTCTIYLDNVTAGILSSIENSGMPECQIEIFRTSLVSKGILSVIESELPQLKFTKQDLIDWVVKEADIRMPRSHRHSKLAVVGMSCRLPGGANDYELFWKLMEEGRDVHTRVPADRFDLSTHYDPTGKVENATQTPFGNFIDKPGLFDAGFFNMSPREAEQTDPMHRLALVTAYEALEMAGYVPNRTPSTNLRRIGTFYGQASDDWRELNASQNIGTYAVPGGERAFANGRVNYFFKFAGPSFNIDTACSSGLAAVNAACSALWSGEADTVLAGGLNVITDPDNYAGLCNGHFLSKTGQCKVWDKDADGYCRADGVGSVVIKRLEDAEADNDNILATILSGATNHSAEAISITHPHAGAQKDNYTQVMQNAGINPLDVSYIELHGTGTQAGDAVESESIASFFAPLTPRRRADQRLRLGAVKCNIGHGEAAAGVASLLKVLLMYQKNQIPPHVGIKTEMNPTIPKDLEKRNVGLNMENTPWPRQNGKKRYAVVNSFGAHGGNTTLLLEDAPEKQKMGNDPRSTYPVAISAKGKNSLKGNIEALISYLDQNPNTDIGDLSYTTCARRIHHNTRIATSVNSIDQLRKFLESSLITSDNNRPIQLETPTIAFAFTGQGAFYNGIGSQLFKDFPYYRSQVLQLDHLVQRFGFPSVVPSIEGSVKDGSSPLVTQLVVVVLEIALAKFWALLGIKPSAVIGHSLGEYAALVVAGVISAADAILLAGKRAEHILAACEAGSHLMLSVRASVEDIKKLCSGNDGYEISCMNGDHDTVISGPRKNIEATRKALEDNGLKCMQLDIPFAFHTAQMDPMLDSFEQTAKHVTFKAPSIPVISPLLSNCVFDSKTINAKYLRRASREPVNFIGALHATRELGVIDEKTVWVDIGPHPVCGPFIRNSIPSSKAVCSLRRNEDNFATISSSLATLHCEGIPVCWNEYFKPYEKAHNLLNLSRYRFNEKDYWIPYIGTWTLDKAHLKYGLDKTPALGAFTSSGSSLRTSLVHQVITEELQEITGKLTIVSDIMQPEFLAAVNGHMMNGCGVATSSIWGDMSFTLGEYLYKRMVPRAKDVHMNITNLEVLHAQVAKKGTSGSQLLQVEANIDLSTQAMTLHWFNISDDGVPTAESFASATVHFENPDTWRTEWDRVAYLVKGRIQALSEMAAEGTANKLSKNMAYTLFKNVVDYADKYRGMRSVVLHEHEAFADIILEPERHGTWHTPPHWIDSVSHLAGLIMNGSDMSNTKDFFYVTPGCGSFRLAKPLEPGARYRNYVRMFPTQETGLYAGDIYIFQDEVIVGMVGQIKFRRVPRLLMDQFFSPPDAKKGSSGHGVSRSAPSRAPKETPAPKLVQKPSEKSAIEQLPTPKAVEKAPEPAPQSAKPDVTPAINESNSVVVDCLRLIAEETGLEPSELTNDAQFVEIGVDSLMSLVLSEKFRNELQVEVKSSLFLECPSIGELKGWLEQYC